MEVSGSYDHCIDAFIENDDEIAIVQTKFESSHDYSEITKFHYEMKRIQEGKVRPTETNEVVQRLIPKIQDAYERNWRVKFYYITNSTFSNTERSKIKRIDGYGTDYFILDLEDIAENLDEKVKDIPTAIAGRWFNLRLSSREILKFEDTTAVIAVSLDTIHDFVASGSNDLFASNVRHYLRGTKINAGIRNTIQENPERFWLYNNGITIVCDDFIEENFSIKIQSPQIVNGCQTAKSIWEILSKKREVDRKSLRGDVLVRIIKGADENEKQNITRYTNTQNAVRGKDFFSLEQFHKQLQSRFKKWGYYYEIQRGAFTALKPSERNAYSGSPEFDYLVSNRFKNVIPSLEAIQSFTSAFKQYPAIAYGLPDQLTPNGQWYDRVFDDQLQPEVRLFLYPYLVREWAKNNGYSRGSEGGWRAHSMLFFVYVHFTVAVEIIKRLSQTEMEQSPQEVALKVWDTLFTAKELNQELLMVTDDILERYFGDSTVVEALGLDIRKYLKSQEMISRHKPILLRYIGNAITSPRNRKLVSALEELLQ